MSLRGASEAQQPKPRQAPLGRTSHADCPSSTAAQIDGATLHEGTTIIDSNDYRAAITRICDSNSRAERKRPVRSCHRARIELLTGCRPASRELLTIIGSNPGPAKPSLSTFAVSFSPTEPPSLLAPTTAIERGRKTCSRLRDRHGRLSPRARFRAPLTPMAAPSSL